MMNKIKISLIIIFSSVVILWSGISFLKYLTHKSSPIVLLDGIEKNGHYSGILNCKVKGENNYKISQITISLNGKNIATKQINSKKIDFPFAIDTTTLESGQHFVEIEAIDASHNQNKFKDKWDFSIDNMPLKVVFLQDNYQAEQGRTIHVRIQANKPLSTAQVRFLEKVYDCYPESELSTTYECFIPVDCETSAEEYTISAEVKDCVKNGAKLLGRVNILAGVFPKQKGFTVSKEKLSEEKDISMNDKILEEALSKWTKDSPKKKLWNGVFEIPIDMKKIATPFGEIRTSQEKGRYLHRAVDLINNPKSVIWASQDGRIIIKDRYLMSGNTVVIDHGLGVFTLYYHMEDFSDIEVGDFVKKGNPIGKVGMTGYANGYHLHWELRVNNTPVDPFQWTKKTF